MNCSMTFPVSTDTSVETTSNGGDGGAVLAREAGVSFQPPLGDASGSDPIAEWLSLMEVVQMLCPVWPVRDRPVRGNYWRI